MRDKIIYVCFLFFQLGVISVFCQTEERCANYANISQNINYNRNKADFESQLQSFISKKKASRQANVQPVITIPVVVHILHDGENIGSGKNLSEAQINSQIQVLNEDYRRNNADTINTNSTFKEVAADVGIEFCLATLDPSCMPTSGITRHKVSKKSFSLSSSDDQLIKSYGYWPSDQYLNIWVCNLTGYLGYATFPTGTGLAGLENESTDSILDGIVVKYLYFGRININSAKYDKGRTATHEIGHWLGLIHTWGDLVCSPFSCPPCGNDYCADTPEQQESTSGCQPKISTLCGSTPVFNMIENYLDYTDDRCMNTFTKDQKMRMHATLEISPRRKRLMRSKGCITNASLSSFPLVDPFETQTIDSKKWQYSADWDLAPFGAYNNSNQSLVIKSNKSNLSTSHEFKSMLLPFSPTTSSSNFIEFDIAYLMGSTTSQDELQIYYLESCDTTKMLLTSLKGNDLITSNRLENDFAPIKEDWKRRRYYFNKNLGGKFVTILFKWIGQNGNNLYLDNINVNNVALASLDVTITPQLNNKQIAVNLDFVQNQVAKISIFDIMGKLIFADTFASFDGAEVIINTQLSAGMYILRTELEGSTAISKKFVIVY